jgi:hypothetical protein
VSIADADFRDHNISRPTNSAARNAMRPFERQCYDWGWGDNEQRIVELIENGTESIAKTWTFSNAIAAAQFKTDDGTDAVSVDDAWLALEAQLNWLLQEIKGEK